MAITDGAGNVTDRAEYSAYGSTTYRTGNTDTPFWFNDRYGVQTDANGMLYMRARYYNPYLCRFLNPDPAGFSGSMNFYVYTDGNPISQLDPFGLSFQSVAKNVAVGAVIGVAGAVVITVAAPFVAAGATAALTTMGLSALSADAVVTFGTGSIAVLSAGVAGAKTGLDVYDASKNGDWDQVGLDAGVLLGAGVFSGYSAVKAGWNMGTDVSMQYQADFGGKVSSGAITPFQNKVNWFAAKPTTESAALASAAAATGPAVFVPGNWLPLPAGSTASSSPSPSPAIGKR